MANGRPGRPKGQKKSGGRQKGTMNHDTALLREMILGALDKAGGQKYLVKQAHKNPSAFLQLVGKVLPKDINATVSGGIAIVVIDEFGE